MPAIRIVVLGRVQGVGFRGFTLRSALGLGITGEVWNRRDGAVECFAEHRDPAVLEKFEESLWSGPGEVREVQVDQATEGGHAWFDVGPTR